MMSTIQRSLAKREDEIRASMSGDAAPRTTPGAAERERDARLDSQLGRDSATACAVTSDAARHPWDSERPFQRLALDQLRLAGALTPDAKRSQLAEEYRLIKRPLLMNVDKKGADIVENSNLIMVTSALPGEGKTFSAINLAISITMERDRTVLLVDGDVAKPTAAKRLGIDNELGLLDVLDGSGVTVEEAMVQTDLPNLRVLPAGKRHERATELLASERMARLMKEFSSRYKDRVVIFDSPPLLLASESAVLAGWMGQILVVVAAEQTPRHAVADGLSRLGQDKIMGLVLNKYRPSLGNRFGAGYGYGYGYGYGSGHGYGQLPTDDGNATTAPSSQS